MAEIWFLVVPILILCLLLVRVIVSKKKKNSRGKLPPGSMGWPYLGETLQLYSQNPNVFFTSKQKR